MKCTTVIWDWNGTLLNDVSISIGAMNRMLALRNLPLLDEVRYRSIFTFPVKDYYDQLGFDPLVDPFIKIGLEFIRYFKEQLHDVGLQAGVTEAISFIKKSGRQQIILSAMEQNALRDNVTQLGIEHWFDNIFGIDNDYGGGKIELAKQVANTFNFSGNRIVLIGDTLHDAEVASAMGWQCVLVASGHQCIERLQTANATILKSPNKIIDWLNNHQE